MLVNFYGCGHVQNQCGLLNSNILDFCLCNLTQNLCVFISDVNDYRLLPAKPNGALIQSVSVASPSTGVYDITLVPYDCGYDFPLFGKINGQIRSGGSISVSRTQPASPPITGTFSVSFKNKTKSGKFYNYISLSSDKQISEIYKVLSWSFFIFSF